MASYSATFSGLLQALIDFTSNQRARNQGFDVAVAKALPKPEGISGAAVWDATNAEWMEAPAGTVPSVTNIAGATELGKTLLKATDPAAVRDAIAAAPTDAVVNLVPGAHTVIDQRDDSTFAVDLTPELASKLDAAPVADTTNFAALIQAAGTGGGGASQSQVDALQAQVDAMPNLVVVPAGQPAPTDLPDGVIVVMEDPTGGTAV